MVSGTEKDSGHAAKDYPEVHICLGTGGVAAGAREVFKAFKGGVEEKNLNVKIGERTCIKQTGCRGLCAMDVLVDIMVPGMAKETYRNVLDHMVPEIIESHLVNKVPVDKWLAKKDYHKFYDKQMRLVLRECGLVDPESLDDYLDEGGYTAFKKAISMDPLEIVEELKISGLRGRGGAGFPTGIKWGFCNASKDKSGKYMIVNADEGDPGAFMDRSILEGSPHAVIEGMAIAAHAIGAKFGYVYCRAEYPLAVKRMNIAIEQARERNLLGDNIMGTGHSFNCIVKEGAGAFVCGEETALMASIEGRRGMPRPRPPFPAHSGLWGKPSNINNVETLANVPMIINNGGAAYAKIGTKKSKGTKVFALTGKIKNTGLIEVPMGITLKEIIDDICGGVPGRNRKFKAAQMGGPSGGCIPEHMQDIEIDFDSLIEAGAMMGSGGIVVMDNTSCMVDMAKFFLSFTKDESCGKCVPCRIGTETMLAILTRITEGKGKEGDIELLIELSDDIKGSSLCGLGQTAPNPVLSTIRYYRDEYEAHIHDKKCPSSVCKELIDFVVDEEGCKKCGICKRICPVDAVLWERKQVARIDLDKCTKCKSCIEECPFLCIH